MVCRPQGRGYWPGGVVAARKEEGDGAAVVEEIRMVIRFRLGLGLYIGWVIGYG